MECPTPCYCCDVICESDDLNFYTDYCECGIQQGCTHGLCDACADEYDGIYEDEEDFD